MMKLYHTGKIEIPEPDIHHGRKNADFGWGFYLTPDIDFARLWGWQNAIINEYELDEEGLQIKRFERDEEWFNYIFNNRRGNDGIQADVIIGPIANDTIFDTFGIISSGFIKPADALKLLSVGPSYVQIAIKTEKAVRQLRWVGSQQVIKPQESQRRKQQEEYSEALSAVMLEIMEETPQEE